MSAVPPAKEKQGSKLAVRLVLVVLLAAVLAVACYYLYTLLEGPDDSGTDRGSVATVSGTGGETPTPEGPENPPPVPAPEQPGGGGDPGATMSFGDAAPAEDAGAAEAAGDAAAPNEGDPATGDAAVAVEGGDAAASPETADAGEAPVEVVEPAPEEPPPPPPVPANPTPPVVPGTKRVLVINSVPSDAPVSINGNNVGRTPVTLIDGDLDLDQRLRIRLSKVAHDNWDMVIEANDPRWRSSGGQERITLDAAMTRHERRRGGGELEPGGARPPSGGAGDPGSAAPPPPPPPPAVNVDDNPYG